MFKYICPATIDKFIHSFLIYNIHTAIHLWIIVTKLLKSIHLLPLIFHEQKWRFQLCDFYF